MVYDLRHVVLATAGLDSQEVRIHIYRKMDWGGPSIHQSPGFILVLLSAVI